MASATSSGPWIVTGAPGWLGSRLLAALCGGIPELPAAARPDAARPVRALVLRGMPPAALATMPPGVERVAGDVRDPASLRALFRDAEGATVLHLCGVISPRRVREFDAVNVEGTRNVLEAAVAARARRVVAVSSNTVAGPGSHPGDVFDERTPPNPRLAYGRSKARMEEMVLEASARGRIEGVVIRPCRFYGPGQPPARTRFYRMIRRGRLPIMGRDDARWSMSYIDDVCQALLLAAGSPVAVGRTYWVADRQPYAVREIVETVARVLERDYAMSVPRRRPRAPVWVAHLARDLDALLQRLGMNDARVHALAELATTSACAIDAACRDLGYAPQTGLEEGTRRAIRWCLDNGEAL